MNAHGTLPRLQHRTMSTSTHCGLAPGQRWLRSTVAKLAVTFIVSFPIGVFTSSMVALSAALCAENSDVLNSEWYCDNDGDGQQTFFFRLLTAWIPSLLLATWNAIVVPFGFAFVALYEGSEITLSGIDRKVFRWFYLYSCLNVLAGGMLAGSFFSQLELMISSTVLHLHIARLRRAPIFGLFPCLYFY